MYAELKFALSLCHKLKPLTDAHALNHYGGGLGAIHYAYFSCTGIETQLADCPVSYTGDRASGICSHYEDAGVMCSSGEENIIQSSVMFTVGLV